MITFNTFLLLSEAYSNITLALDYARKVHAGQQRRTNKTPYFTHVFRVSKMAKELKYDEKVQIAAALHDAIEDGSNPEKIKEIIKSKFGDEILKVVLILTHDKNIPYDEYLLKLAQTNEIAFKVKMLDMYDNLTDNPRPSQVEKYKNAIKFLIDKKMSYIIPQKIVDILKLS